MTGSVCGAAETAMKSIEETFRSEQFRKQNRSARRPAQKIVRKPREFVIGYVVAAKPARADRHAVAFVPIEPGLRAVVLRKITYKALRGGREAQALRQPFVGVPPSYDLVFSGG